MSKQNHRNAARNPYVGMTNRAALLKFKAYLLMAATEAAEYQQQMGPGWRHDKEALLRQGKNWHVQQGKMQGIRELVGHALDHIDHLLAMRG